MKHILSILNALKIIIQNPYVATLTASSILYLFFKILNYDHDFLPARLPQSVPLPDIKKIKLTIGKGVFRNWVSISPKSSPLTLPPEKFLEEIPTNVGLQPLPPSKMNSKYKLKVVTWNIQRGFHLTKIVSWLKQIDPDVILLQEVDCNCKRTSYIDIGGEIASVLNMYQVSTFSLNVKKVPTCFYGDCILSKFPVLSAWAAPMSDPRQIKVSSKTSTKSYRKECAAAAIISTPLGPISFYSVHFAPRYTGIRGRQSQFRSICADHSLNCDQTIPCIIAGDFNTVAPGYKRFTLTFCCDDLRWATWGQTEAQYWSNSIFKSHHKNWKDSTANVNNYTLLGGLLMNDKLDWMVHNSKLTQNLLKIAGNDASDHNFILCEFSMKKNALLHGR